MKLLKLICVLASILFLAHSKPLKKSKLIKAINCGSKEGSIKSEAQIKYQHDTGMVSGNSIDVDYHSDSNAVNAEIKYTFDKDIFLFERHTYSQMTYALPVKTGKHTIILKFAEMYFEKIGQRVFNIKIGDKIAIENMDVIERAGSKYAAHEEYVEFQIKTGSVYFNGEKVPNGLKDGKLQLTFAKGKADNPIIQAIVVYNGGVQQTTKEQYLVMKKSWSSHQELIKARKQNEQIKEMLAIQKKKEKVIIRNDQLLITDQTSNNEAGPQVTHDKYGTVRSFLMSPIGILIWAALFGYKIYFVYSKIFKMNQVAQLEEDKNE